MKLEEWLGEDNKLGCDIWQKKYQFENETFDEWLDRVSGKDEDVKQIIKEKKFLFGGRILANRGTESSGRKISLSNCYVITPPEDNIESIFDCAKKLARTYSYGGGCGIDIGKLSPIGAKIHNAAKQTSGSVSFMDLYSSVTGLIGQAGRRGALMISIPCDHPDLEEFIKIKQNDNKVTKANISIRVTDDFMKAVKNREKYKLSFTRTETGENISKEVDAYEVFKEICRSNWDWGEPGMLFWDRIETWNLLSEDSNFHYGGVNPCFAGNMGLLTTEGYKTFEELCDTEPEIINVNGDVVKSKVWCSGEKDTVTIKLGNNEIIVTPEHRFMTIDGNECMAKDLKGKRIMPITSSNIKHNDKYIKYGFIQGDGQLTRLNSEYHKGIEVNIGVKDTDIRDLFKYDNYNEVSNRSIYLYGYIDELNKLGFSANILPDRTFPSSYNQWSFNEKASFLQGCYSANGSVIKHGRISYKTTSKVFAEELCATLLDDFNIHAYITNNKPKMVKFENGEYECRESYDVTIGRYKDITIFTALINFYQQYKREQLAIMLKKRASYVYNVVPNKKIRVYDFIEPDRHWGVVEGYIVHNCAEEPLPSGGSCLLGSINLSEFVTENKSFDFDDFRTTVNIAVKALNDVLDEGLPMHPLQEQRDSVRDWRQIGLGVFGIADMLIKMGIKYGDEKSLQLCDEIGQTMASQAILMSSSLACEFRPYPKYNMEYVGKSGFFKEHVDEGYRETILQKGLYNSQLLTIAPTGTLSTMLRVSGGIEPIFANYYTRKTESLHGHDEYYKVYTPIVKEYMDSHGIKDDKDLPDFFTTAQTLKYEERIAMQSVWQKHIDASISSTVNVPYDFPLEDVENIYMLAWEKGLKGITMFRDGCKRAGILTVKVDEENDNDGILKRGMIIKVNDNCIGKKRTLHTGCGTLHCTAFFDPISGDLLETYFSKGSSGGCQNFMVGLSRMISLAARGGVDVYSIVDQLKSSGTCPAYAVRTATKHDTSKGSCCPVAIGNALIDMYKEMMSEVSEEDYKEIDVDNKPTVFKEVKVLDIKCPQCGGKLVFEGGCNTCKDCGWSKCD